MRALSRTTLLLLASAARAQGPAEQDGFDESHVKILTEADLADNEQQINRCFGCAAAAAGPRLTNPLIQRTHSYGATSGAEGVERAD